MSIVRASIGLALAAFACASVSALSPSDLQSQVVDELVRAGLVTDAAPVPGFRWTLENKRPLRNARSVDEQFGPAPDGLSVVQRAITYRDGEVDRSEYVSARGLLKIDREDQTIGVTIVGMKLPPQPGEQFSLSMVRDGTPVRERCVVGERSKAEALFAALPGDALAIECMGEGKYAGLNVRVSSKVVYLEELGVFLNRLDVLDTPLGKFENTTRITDFKLNPKP